MTPNEEQILLEKKKQAIAAASIPMHTPGSPTSTGDSSPASGIAAPPEAIMINGIRHQNLPDQRFPGPLSMVADAAAGTIGHIATAPFGNRAEERLAANRAELSNDTAEPQAKPKPTPATSAGITGGVQAVANQGVSDLAGRQAGHMTDNNLRQFEDKGNGVVRQVGATGKTEFTNVGTTDITDPTKKIPVNTYSGAADNESMARANAIRQQIIDRQPAGGIGILGDGGIEAANAEKTQRWANDSLLAGTSGRERTAALTQILAGQNQIAAEGMRSATTQRGQDINSSLTARGQDLHAQTAANQLAGNPQDQELKRAQATGIMAQTDSTRQQNDLRNKLLTETDPAKRTAMQEAMLVAQGRDPNQGRYIRMGGGEQVIDQATGQKAKLPDQVFDSRTGQTVQTGKRGLSDTDFDAIGKKIGMPGDALKARYREFQKQGPASSLKDFNAVDVALSLADGTPPEKIAATIKRLGGNPADYGL